MLAQMQVLEKCVYGKICKKRGYKMMGNLYGKKRELYIFWVHIYLYVYTAHRTSKQNVW